MKFYGRPFDLAIILYSPLNVVTSTAMSMQHFVPQMQPKFLDSFDSLKVVAISTGDEFSLALDEKGVPWVWGKGDKGQVGCSTVSVNLLEKKIHYG